MPGQADAQASFAINLEDGTSGAAESAASALKDLRAQIEGDTKALREMQAAMKNLQAGTSVNVEQFRDLRDKIAAKKQAVAQAQSSYLSLGGTFGKTAAEGKRVSSSFAAIALAARGAPGPLGVLVQRMGGLGNAIKAGLIAAGIVAIAAGLAVLTVASVTATAALFKYGVAQADARRNELLRLQGLTKLRNYWGIPAGNAAEMQEAIDRVSGSVSIGRDKIAQYSDQLYKMGLRGGNLEAALEGVAIKAAVQGDAQAQAFAGWAAGAALAGKSVRALSDDVKARLGGVAAAQMLSLGVQSEKLRENWDALFGGLKIEGLLKGLSSVTSLFSQNAAVGRALKAMFEVMFQPFIDGAAAAAPIVKRFFQGLTIAALELGILLLQVRNWFKRTFGGSDVLKGFDATTAAVTAGKVALGLFAGALALTAALAAGLAVKLSVALVPAVSALVVKIGALAVAGLAVAWPFLLAAVAIGAVIAAGYQLFRLWQEIDWKGLGKSIIDGIVGGVRAGAKWVTAAVSNLGSGAWGAFKKALGISSPSRAFAQLGLAIPKGLEVGVHAGTPAARRAVAGIVDAPSMGPRLVPDAAGGGASGGARGGGPSTTISIGEIHIHAASDRPSDMALDFARELERVLERVAIQLGAPLPGGA